MRSCTNRHFMYTWCKFFLGALCIPTCKNTLCRSMQQKQVAADEHSSRPHTAAPAEESAPAFTSPTSAAEYVTPPLGVPATVPLFSCKYCSIASPTGLALVGFWPVIRFPSVTTNGFQSSTFLKWPPSSLSLSSSRNGTSCSATKRNVACDWHDSVSTLFPILECQICHGRSVMVAVNCHMPDTLTNSISHQRGGTDHGDL